MGVSTCPPMPLAPCSHPNHPSLGTFAGGRGQGLRGGETGGSRENCTGLGAMEGGQGWGPWSQVRVRPWAGLRGSRRGGRFSHPPNL